MNKLSSMDFAFTTKLNEIIHANLENENFGVKELAREIGMSRFNLNRKLHRIESNTRHAASALAQEEEEEGLGKRA